MRTIQTFVVRLLASSDEPEALRGMLHAVASGEEQSFADGPALLLLLKRMMCDAPGIMRPDPEKKNKEEER